MMFYSKNKYSERVIKNIWWFNAKAYVNSCSPTFLFHLSKIFKSFTLGIGFKSYITATVRVDMLRTSFQATTRRSKVTTGTAPATNYCRALRTVLTTRLLLNSFHKVFLLFQGSIRRGFFSKMRLTVFFFTVSLDAKMFNTYFFPRLSIRGLICWFILLQPISTKQYP